MAGLLIRLIRDDETRNRSVWRLQLRRTV